MAPEVSCPAALRLPGRGVGFRGAFREKTPTALKQEGRLASLTAFFIRFCTARQSWRGYSGVLIQAWSSSQVNNHFRSGPAMTFR
ncbi:hypothetical protein CPA58_08265 [Klebsiella pneumoniae]|nr:hypothetical protein CPA58_08265 [Klebsiella pneumoniae]